MMSNNATFIRIFNANPDDDFVQKRDAAIKEVADKIAKKRNVVDIIQYANDLVIAMTPKAAMPEGMAAIVEAAVTKQSQSFVREGEQLQMLTCAFAAVHLVLENAQSSNIILSTADLVAVALWLGLSSQPPRSEPKLEALRVAVLNLSRDLVAGSAAAGRKRQTVPDLTVTLGEDGTVGLDEKIKKGALRTIDALRSNAALDREEIDFLWWVLADRSTMLGEKVSDSKPAAAAVASGWEAGQLLRRLPTEAHKSIVFSKVTDARDAITLPELIANLGEDREKLAAQLRGNSYLSSNPAIFVLGTALLTGQSNGPTSKIKYPLREWCARAFLESAVLRLTEILPPALAN